MKFSIQATVLISIGYLLWPVIFGISSMALGGGSRDTSRRMYGLSILAFYYPVYIAAAAAVFKWQFFNIPGLWHIPAVFTVVTAVLWFSGHLLNFMKYEPYKDLSGVVVNYDDSMAAGGGFTARVELITGKVETVHFDHTFPYHNLMRPGFSVPLLKNKATGELTVRVVPELVKKNLDMTQ